MKPKINCSPCPLCKTNRRVIRTESKGAGARVFCYNCGLGTYGCAESEPEKVWNSLCAGIAALADPPPPTIQPCPHHAPVDWPEGHDSVQVLEWTHRHSTGEHSVKCLVCGWFGRPATSREHAIKLWNEDCVEPHPCSRGAAPVESDPVGLSVRLRRTRRVHPLPGVAVTPYIPSQPPPPLPCVRCGSHAELERIGFEGLNLRARFAVSCTGCPAGTHGCVDADGAWREWIRKNQPTSGFLISSEADPTGLRHEAERRRERGRRYAEGAPA